MIAETIPEAYDAFGHQVSQPFLRRKGPHPTFPMGRYLSQPLTVRSSNVEEVREFLCGCRPVSDEELFGKRDYWQPPEEFEKRKAGDCEDFSLWTWRQLLMLGLDARIVFGKHGRYGTGHAWVMFFQEGKCFLGEPQAALLGARLPRLATLQYDPNFSVAWDGKTLRYYAHKENREFQPSWKLVISLIPEWTAIWSLFWLRNPMRAPRFAWKLLHRKVLKRELWLQSRQ